MTHQDKVSSEESQDEDQSIEVMSDDGGNK